MEIDETDGNGGHIYRLKKLMKYRKCSSPSMLIQVQLILSN